MSQSRAFGVFAAFAGPALWGILPLFYVLLEAFSAFEIVIQRSFFSLVLLGLYFLLAGQLRAIITPLLSWRMAGIIMLGAVMIGANWLLFVYAIEENRVVEASFGYFIYPLIAVATGVLFLKERLDRRGWVALALSAVAVIIKGISLGALPDISLALALTFAAYALLRKQIQADALQGLFLEVIVLLPVVGAFFIWQMSQDIPLFLGGGTFGLTMSVLCGFVTIIPLALFLRGNKTLPLSLTGLLFYINPSLQLAVGVLALGEAFSLTDLAAFGLIWSGLILQFARPSIWRSAQP